MFKAFGTGRLVADPELTDITSNDGKDTCVARFTVAVNEYRKAAGQKVQQTSFFDCEAWDSGARTLAEHAKKGDLLTFEARPRQNKWVTKDGENRQRVIFRVEEFFITPKRVNTEQKNESVAVGTENDSTAQY